MLDSPIKFPSSPSSNKDELPSQHSFEENVSSDDRMSDYSPPWSSMKEDPEEEDKVDKDEDNADVDADVEDDDDSADNSDDFDSNFASPPPKRSRRV
jgi:hypothetical protein